MPPRWTDRGAVPRCAMVKAILKAAAQFMTDPKLWLVIAGKMSVVGPRPEMPTLSASFDEAFVVKRVAVQPGCTGLWQISTSARKLIGEAPEFDLHYVNNWTLRLDLWIAMRTLPTMMGGNEISSPADIPRWTGAAVR